MCYILGNSTAKSIEEIVMDRRKFITSVGIGVASVPLLASTSEVSGIKYSIFYEATMDTYILLHYTGEVQYPNSLDPGIISDDYEYFAMAVDDVRRIDRRLVNQSKQSLINKLNKEGNK